MGIGLSSRANKVDIQMILKMIHDVKVTALATLKSKEDHPIIQSLSSVLSVSLLSFDVQDLENQTAFVKNPSSYLFHRIGCHSVCEAAALAACGKNSQLLLEKTKIGGLTLALARSY